MRYVRLPIGPVVGLAASAALTLASSQYGCSSFGVHGPSAGAAPAAGKAISIAPSRPVVRVHEVTVLRITTGGDVRVEQPIIWTSSDTEVLTVVSLGERARVAAISPGAARVSVNTANGYTASVMVRVHADLTAASSR